MNEIKFKSDNRADKFTYKISLYRDAILSLPKTIYFNLRCFPLPVAIKFPIMISYRIKIIEIRKGTIRFVNSPKTFGVKIGFGGSDGIVERKGEICLDGGCIYFEGKADFCKGTSLRNEGIIHFGNNFFANRNCTIWCSKEIKFGDNVLLGWNVVFRDSDGHLIIDNGNPRPVNGNIHIGNHCWICSETHILKNSGLGDDCVLAYGSILTRIYDERNVLYTGIPARPQKRNINWLRGAHDVLVLEKKDDSNNVT